MEINPRQARSSYYLAALGYNLVDILTEDVFEHKENTFALVDREYLLSMVPKSVIKKYIANDDYRAEALKLWRKGRKCDPLKYSDERSLKHKFYLILRAINYKKKYKIYTNTI